MSPTYFLLMLMFLTAGAGAASMIAERRRRAALRWLAKSWQMHYTPHDRFHLASRVASRLPTTGAAAVRVNDLIYGLEGEHVRYIFTVRYTSGTMSAQVRRESTVTFSEPRERRDDSSPIELLQAPAELSVVEQYEHLRKRVMPLLDDAA